MKDNTAIELQSLIKAISENSHTILRVFVPVFGVVEALTHTLLCAGSTP